MNEKVISKKAPESCLKKAAPTAMAKKPVSFKSRIAEDIVDKDSETEKLRTDKWSAADTLERAAAFAEGREKKGLEEVESDSVEKKRKIFFFGDSADKTAWTTEDWIEEHSTKKERL